MAKSKTTRPPAAKPPIAEEALRWLGVGGTALLFAALVLYLYQGELQGPAFMLLALGLAGLALWMVFAPDDLRGWLTGRRAAGGSTSFILLIAFTAFVVTAYAWVDRLSITVDLTNTQKFSLSIPSQETMASLERSGLRMRLIGFFPRSALREQEAADIILRQYDETGGEAMELVYVDPDQDPLTAQQYAYRDYIVFSDGGQGAAVFVSFIDEAGQVDLGSIRPIVSLDERTVSSTIAEMINVSDKVLYFTTGHAELDIESLADTGLSRAVSALGPLNLRAARLNLLTDDIPADAAGMVIAGGATPFLPEEVDKLAAYLAGGGRLILLANPPYVDATFGGLSEPAMPDSPLGQYLWNEYGIRLRPDLVVDEASSFDSPFSPVPATYNFSHPIIAALAGNTALVFILARSIEFAQTPSGPQLAYNLAPLMASSDESYGETSLRVLPTGTLTEFDPATDPLGPLNLAAVVWEKNEVNLEPGTRLVVVGDVDWITNQYIINLPSNGLLWAEMAEWVTGSPQLVNADDVSIRPELIPIFASEQERQQISVLTTLILPGLVLVLGAGVSYLRRRG
jgi:hypothetical protein